MGDLNAEREGGGLSPTGKLRKQLLHGVVNTGRGIRTGLTPGWVTCSLAVWPRAPAEASSSEEMEVMVFSGLPSQDRVRINAECE